MEGSSPLARKSSCFVKLQTQEVERLSCSATRSRSKTGEWLSIESCARVIHPEPFRSPRTTPTCSPEVLAHVELVGAGKQLVLSSVNRDGELGWSRALGFDDVRGARLIGDLLVVVLGDSLIGLDPASGAVRFLRPL